MLNFDTFKSNRTEFPNIYLGIVEDNNDDTKAGRCRVRIIGLHSDSKSDIPTAHLPWAIPALPIFEGANSGLGIFSVPVQGSLVAIFFIGGNHEYPVYFASIPAVPKEKAVPEKGFSDPNGKYPTYTGDPDWNKNSRGTNGITKTLETGIPTALGNTWSEPSSPYKAEYPYNTVIETRDKGVVIELDSTSDNERYHIYHKRSGNYFEISGNGQTVMKSNDNHYEINVKGKNILIKGTRNEYIGEDSDKVVIGDETIVIDGDQTTKIDGQQDNIISGTKNDLISGNLNISVAGSCNIYVDGACLVSANTITLDGKGTGTAGSGIVTGESICPFINGPHQDVSTSIFATK